MEESAQSLDIVKELMGITLLGSEWVLWLLLALSVLSLGIILERCGVLWMGRYPGFSSFIQELKNSLKSKDTEAAKILASRYPGSLESRMALLALEAAPMGSSSVQKLVSSFILRERLSLDRGLVVLGTLGNNAPFIGLFGTVLGIIQAFHALSLNPGGGAPVIMAGISEALIATAVGLMVAIPAVIAYNGFQRLIKNRIAQAESVQELVLAYMMEDPKKP
jgi:biopolymer transport protein ExbB/TolQ